MRRALRDLVTHGIGIGILVYTGVVLWGPLTSSDPLALERAQKAFALLAGLVGTVVGFYFGTKSGEQVAEQADARTANVTRTAEQELEDVGRLANDLRRALGIRSGRDTGEGQ